MTNHRCRQEGTEIAIASDALVTFVKRGLPHGYEMNEKIFKCATPTSPGRQHGHFAVFAQALHHWGRRCCWAVARRFFTPSSACIPC